MTGTIALLTIFSAILVFFIDELTAYAKALVARPYIFLIFGLVTLTSLVDMHSTKVLWLLITGWIALLLEVQWLADHLVGNGAEQFLAKWLVAVVLPMIPMVIALGLHAHRQRIRASTHHDLIIKRGQRIALVLWGLIILMLALGQPGSDFAGV